MEFEHRKLEEMGELPRSSASSSNPAGRACSRPTPRPQRRERGVILIRQAAEEAGYAIR